MAIAIEGYTVVVLRSRIEEKYSGGMPALSATVPNATEIMDDDLWRCAFMAMSDANQFVASLRDAGLQADQGPDPDLVIVAEFDRSVAPYCEWLRLAQWKKGVIAWREGSDPTKLVVRQGWSPEKGSGLEFAESDKMDHHEFLRREGNVEVYRDKNTGEEVYIGRTGRDPGTVHQAAAKVITSNMVDPGQPGISEDAAVKVRQAVEDLEWLVSKHSPTWQTYWCLGKGRQALGDADGCYEALKQAWEMEQTNEIIPRELCGVCLELGKTEEAVLIGERAAASLPDNSETLGNLAVAYLLAARIANATTTIEAALRLAPDDEVNRTVQRMIQEVAAGERPQPRKLSDLTRQKK